MKNLLNYKEFLNESLSKKSNSVHDIDTILKHYIIAALWSTNNPDSEEEEFLDENHSIEDVDKETYERMKKDVTMFVNDNKEALDISGLDDEQIGHDFWLTRNGHGAGFFDRRLDKDIEKKLMDGAKKFKGVDLYVEDGKVKDMFVNNESISESEQHTSITNKDAEPAGLKLGTLVRNIDELKINELYWIPSPSGVGRDYPVLACLNDIEGDMYKFENTPDDFPQEVHDAATADPHYYDDNDLYQGMWVELSKSEMVDLVKSGKIFKFEK